MTNRCPTPEELALLAGVARGDPRRAHVDACPRCEGVLISYQEFLKPGELPAAAMAAQASDRLGSLLRREILGTGLPQDRSPRPHPANPSLRNRLRLLLRTPLFAPAMAVVAVAAIVIIAVREWPGSTGDAGLRSGVPTEASEAVVPVPVALRTGGDGGLVLEWRPPAGCDRSVVVFYAEDLTEVARHQVGAAPRLPLPTGLEDPSAGKARYWRVLCLQGAREISRSTIQELVKNGP